MENITPANQNKLNASTYSEALTAFTVGWQDSGAAKILDFVAPAIPVGRRFEFKRADNAEAFYSESDDLRAIGSEFKRVRYSGESVNEKTLNKGLTMRVDHDEVADDGWQERYTQILLQRLLRNELRRAVLALETVAKANGSPSVWDSSANPDSDIRAMLSACADESGVRPNKILFGEDAWAMRLDSLESQSTAVALRASSLTPAELAAKFLLEGCEVMSARYQQTPAQKAKIASNKIFAFSAFGGVSKDEPSNLKRFYTPSSEGTAFKVYLEEHAKYTDITVEHYSTIVAASTLGVRALEVSNS
ncbi:MAG: hypothetical protein IKS15_03435 [Opitutales bacterium]|nr:hypothetical protein [Opitutales bacterium]